jgi:MerR family redox-sensitive transcriptional activator SoxR
MSIGELAKRVQKRPSALRYYEALGLLPEPARVDGRRRYSSDFLRTLAVIEKAQGAGLNLTEIKVLLDASLETPAGTEQLRAIAAGKLDAMEALLQRARTIRQWLINAADCRCPSLDSCPLFTPDPSACESVGC